VGDSSKLVIQNDDLIQITLDPPCVSPPLVPPLTLVASGYSQTNNQVVCVEGDEYPPLIANSSPVPYMYPPYVIPGTGTIKITLNSDNKTSKAKDKDKKMLLKGSGTFQVELDVQSPAQMPTPTGPQPDPQSKHTGTGQFITTNTVVYSE
jgi:hypothetical protein